MRISNKVKIGTCTIGGGLTPVIQTMLDFPTADYKKVNKEIKKLYTEGCEIIRLAIKNEQDSEALKKIMPSSPIPVIGDIHFNYKLALTSIKNGVNKIRINPGNIGLEKNVKSIIDCAKDHQTAIRIGVNAGSLPAKYTHPSPKAMVETALEHIDFFEKNNFSNIVISLKSSNVKTTLDSYRLLSKKCPYPFHAGITEAGIPKYGIIKSSLGMGLLISEGLADTFRVSLTASPSEEIKVSKAILKFMGFNINMPEIISCPTCGRCGIDLQSLANKVDDIVSAYNTNITIAVMGCIVNGPGEAKEADIGIAGGIDTGIIFVHGKEIETVPYNILLDRFKFHFLKIINKKENPGLE